MEKKNYMIRMVLMLIVLLGNMALSSAQNCPPPVLTCPQNYVLTAPQDNCSVMVEYALPAFQTDCPCVAPTSLQGFTLLALHNNHSYLISNTQVTWETANVIAQQLGGHLATITSAEENQAISAGFTQQYSAWIGLREVAYEGDWQWVTGEPLSYTNWNLFEPNNSDYIEAYGEMYSDGPWNDLAGYQQQYFIIEFECAGLVQTSGLPSGSEFPLGVTTNTFSYTDNNNQTTTCSFTVTVNDITPPVINCPPDMTYHCPDQVNYPLPTATDNCSGNGTEYSIGSCTYELFSMSGATTHGSCDDCVYSSIPLPFTFTFFGNDETYVNLSTNGFLYFGSGDYGSGCCQGQQLPTGSYPKTIAGGWTDLYTTVRSKVFGSQPNRVFVVDWSGTEYSGSAQQHFQIALYEQTNEIRIITEIQELTSQNHLKTMGLNYNESLALPVSGRNSSNWEASTECISFRPSIEVVLVSGIPTGGAFPPGVTTLVYSASDESGNTSSCSFNITIDPWFGGEFTVGTEGDYENLTGPDGLFQALNSQPLCGVTARIISDLDEPGLHSLNELTFEDPSVNNLVITADEYSFYEISGDVADALIRFNGAQNVIFGTQGEYVFGGQLFFVENRNPSYPTLQLTNGASDNRFAGCYFVGSNSNPASGVVVLGADNLNEGNNNNTFFNNIFGMGNNTQGYPANLFYSAGNPSNPNSGNSLAYNMFNQFGSNALYVNGNGNGSYWRIWENLFNFPGGAPTANKTFINFVPGINSLENELYYNYIGYGWYYAEPLVINGAGFVKGIVVNASYTEIQRNYINNLNLAGTGILNFTGIDVTGGYNYVYNNAIGRMFDYGEIQVAGTGTFIGINSSSTDNVYIEQNYINNIKFTKTTGSPIFKGIQLKRGYASNNTIYDIFSTNANLTPTFYGICNVANGLTSPNYIVNNMIAMNAGISSKPKVYGLFDQSIGIGANFLHNSVHLYGNTSNGYSTAAFYRIGNATVYLVNNILVNKRVSNVMAKHTAIEINTPANFVSNYNVLYTISNSLAKIAGTLYPTMTSWKMFSFQDNNSLNVAPVFFSNTDLHLYEAENWMIDGAGNPFMSVEFDYDYQYRGYSTPDPGADEFGEGGGGGEGPAPKSDLSQEIIPEHNGMRIYPNPFTATTTMEINLTADDQIMIDVFNIMGERMLRVTEGSYSAGTYSFTLDGTDLPSGTYICRFIINGTESIVKRMEIIK